MLNLIIPVHLLLPPPPPRLSPPHPRCLQGCHEPPAGLWQPEHLIIKEKVTQLSLLFFNMAIHKKIKRQHLTRVVSENLQYFIVMEAFPKRKEKKKNLDVPARVAEISSCF